MTRLFLSARETAAKQSPHSWGKFDDAYVCGHAYVDGYFLQGADLAALFNGVGNGLSFESTLNQLNGHFAVIIDRADSVYAAVDRVSSTPLLYRTSHQLEIGDDFNGFLRADELSSPESIMQFLASGYVHGENTLLASVRQLTAGSFLVFDKRSGRGSVNQYYRYIQRSQCGETDHRPLIEELHEVHHLIFSRLVRSLNGRQAIVPLSGGYDSRLVVEMLHHFGHRNTLCVTWGAEDYWQVAIAQDVARSLGMQWIRVGGGHSDWSRWYNSGGLDRELELCGAIATIPYVQDNLVFEQLKASGLMNTDAIFISGNAGDFIEGGHIFDTASAVGKNELVRAMTKFHLRQSPVKDLELASRSIRRDSELYLSEFGDISGFDEHWEWRERQSKFVSKSIKPFEVAGFDWRLPFWDFELMEFWASVPRELKAGRRLFYEYASIHMRKDVLQANPKVGVITRYMNALGDGRYGCYCFPFSAARGLFKDNRSIAGINIADFVRARPLGLSRFNGLVASDVLGRVLQATGGGFLK